jgi:hypothetical protein
LVISEKEKYDLLYRIISLECPIKTILSKDGSIDGYYDPNDVIIVTELPKELKTEREWSEAGCMLLHEFGHSMHEHSERKAWRRAEKWIDRYFPQLKPLYFKEIEKECLDGYKVSNQLRKEFKKCFDFNIAKERCNKWLKKYMPTWEITTTEKFFLKTYKTARFEY